MSWVPSEPDARHCTPAGRALRAVIEHVNEWHVLETLLIVWTVGGLPGAGTATLTAIDRRGLEFRADVEGSAHVVRIAWTQPVRTWADLQLEMHALNAQASADWAARAAV